jgi:hypothetical protein
MSEWDYESSGGETTLEDRIIYDEEIMPLIDEALTKIYALPEVTGYPKGLRGILETLVFKVVKHERSL